MSTITIIGLFVIVASFSCINAVTYTWVSITGGSMKNSSNWRPLGVPGSGDILIVNNTGPQSISIDFVTSPVFSSFLFGSNSSGIITITAVADFGFSQSSRITGNINFVFSTATVTSSSLLTLDAPFSGAGAHQTINNAIISCPTRFYSGTTLDINSLTTLTSDMTISSGTILTATQGISFVSCNLVTLPGSILDVRGYLYNNGGNPSLVIGGTSILHSIGCCAPLQLGVYVTISGTVTVFSGCNLMFDGGVTLTPTSIIIVNGDSMSFTGPFIIQGSITINSGVITYTYIAGNITSTAVITQNAGSHFMSNLVNDGTIVVNGGSFDPQNTTVFSYKSNLALLVSSSVTFNNPFTFRGTLNANGILNVNSNIVWDGVTWIQTTGSTFVFNSFVMQGNGSMTINGGSFNLNSTFPAILAIPIQHNGGSFTAGSTVNLTLAPPFIWNTLQSAVVNLNGTTNLQNGVVCNMQGTINFNGPATIDASLNLINGH
jgi:hypothetical protein